MQKEIKLSQFQLETLADLIAKTENAKNNQSQFVGMCLASAGENPVQEKLEFKDGKLTWEENVISLEPEPKA